MDQETASTVRRVGRPAMEAHLEGLRGVAIAAVVLYHLGARWFSGGAHGVDVFFVISGFVITRSLLAEQARTGRVHLAGFFARRVRRLLPVSTLVLVVTLGGLLAWWPPFLRTPLGGEARAAALGYTNVWSAVHAVDYGGRDDLASPFGHLWSLALEEQFYLVVAPAFVVLVRLARGRVPERRALLAVLVPCAIASFGLAQLYARGDRPALAFYLLEARAWELLVGVVLALVPWVAAGGAARLRAVAGWLGLGSVAVAVEHLPPLGGRPTLGPLLAVGGAALVIAGGSGLGRPTVGRVLALAPLRRLGSIAYPLYLWHWVVLVALTQRYPRLRGTGTIVVVTSVALAWLTHVAIEQRIRWWRPSVARPRTTIAVGLAALGVVALASVPITRARPLGVRPSVPGQETTWIPTDLRPPLESVIGGQDQPTPPCTMVDLAPETSECTYGDPAGATTVMVLGDSHARFWVDALDEAGRTRGWRVVLRFETGCPWVALVDPDDASDPVAAARCRQRRDDAIDLMAAAPPDLLIVTNWYAGQTQHESRAEYVAAALATAARFPPHQPMLVLGDVPEIPADALTCLGEHPDDIRPCAIDRSDGLDADSRRTVRATARALGAAYRDSHRWVCPTDRCPLIRGDLLLYRDETHLTTQFARSLAPQLGAAVQDVLDHPRRR